MKKTIITLLFCFVSILSYLSAQEYNSETVELYSHYAVKENKLTENTSSLIQINKRQGDDDAHIALFSTEEIAIKP